MAGGLPEIAPHDVRGVDERVAALEIGVAHPVFESLADDAALGMEEDQAGAGEFLNAEEIELFADFAVVALLCFFELVEVFVEIFFGEPDGAVDALELLVFFVALPVGAGDGVSLNALIFEVSGTCGPRQKSMKSRAESVFGEGVVGFFFDELDFHGLIHGAVFFEASGFADQFALEGEAFRLEFPHFASIFSRSSGVKGSGRSKS